MSVTVTVDNKAVECVVKDGITGVASDYKEHIVTINIDAITKDNQAASNYFDITWTSSAPYQNWFGALSQARPGIKVYMLKPGNFTEGDRVRCEYSDALTTIQLSGIASGMGDPGQINGVTFLIRYPV